MANYDSQYTGNQIDTAVGRALSPDSSPSISSDNLMSSGGTATALDALNATLMGQISNVGGLRQATALASGDNLNTVPIGACYCPSSAIGQTLLNSPVQTTFVLLTLNRGTFNMQILVATGDIYTRLQGYRWYKHTGVAIE